MGGLWVLLVVVPAEQVKNDGVPHALAAVQGKSGGLVGTRTSGPPHISINAAIVQMQVGGSRCDAERVEGTTGGRKPLGKPSQVGLRHVVCMYVCFCAWCGVGTFQGTEGWGRG